MKVLFIARRADLGNGGYKLQKCLERVGVTSLAIQTEPHVYGYPKQAKICTYEEILAYAEKTEIIIFMSSAYVDLGSLKDKRIFVFHRGWRYRKDPKRMNEFFNPIIEKSLITSPDLLGLGAKNEVWVSFPIDVDKIHPVWTQNKKLIISHFPPATRKRNRKSHEGSKGSKVIIQIFKKLGKELGDKVEFEVGNFKPVPWKESLKRMSRCDVYVERCITSFKGMKTGEWGNTAVETAALGKIVVASFLSRKKYEQEFGPCPIQDANSPEELESVLKKLIWMDPLEIQKLKQATVDWVKKYHSYEAMGRRLERIIE